MKYLLTLIISLNLTLSVYAQNNQQIDDKSKESSVEASQQLKNDIKLNSSSKNQINPDLNKNNINEKLIDPNKSSLNIIEIDGVKYIKDDFRYIPLINPDEQIVIEESEESEDPEIETIFPNKKTELSYFGYKIFNADPSDFQASTFGAVDPYYNIGPGDQIIVMLWGESEFRQEFTIDPEGYVFVPEVGQIFVNGLNLEALEQKFFQTLSKVYSTLNPSSGKATTFMDISIGNLRPLRIIVLGEVSQPGAYSVSPSTSLSTSLYYFQGPTSFGSLRDIRLIRKGKKVGSIDFYNYLLSGNIPNDYRLQLDDVVFIPNRGKTVSIRGQINREGIYELKDGEGLNELFKIAGGLKISAYMNRAQIKRILPVNERLELGMDRMLIDIDLISIINDKEIVELYDGDEIEIFAIEKDQKNYVFLGGASVVRPGKYQLTPNMRIRDLINVSGGLLNSMYVDKVHLVRLKEDLNKELFSINLQNALDGKSDDNIKLKALDEIFIYDKNILTNSFEKIIIEGPVKSEGSYYLESNKTLGDLIISTGGFINGVKRVKITISRKNRNSIYPLIYHIPNKKNKEVEFFTIDQLKNPNHYSNNFVLKSSDLITIYSDPRDSDNKKVTIKGEVSFPGTYSIISRDDKVSDIIERAGGLTDLAYSQASILIRERDEIKLSFQDIIRDNKSKENFRVLDGDIIDIGYKTNIITILGEVNNPGKFKFYNNMSLRGYIKIAGGLTNNAEKKDIWILYPNGISKKLYSYRFSPKVIDSSTIRIGRKEDRDPIDRTELAKEIASIISDFLQIALTLVLLSNTSAS